ncbi:MAG TPA: hypothetical protein VKB59_14890 [Micromonosporaceae bacterium]|nr:hypothetical protein [Micromonosporaceae bacterium]
MDQGYSAYEVSTWCSAVDQLHDYAIRRAFSRRDVEHAVGAEISRWGFVGAPMPVLLMMTRAIEAGYAFALRDVREGRYDREIAQWRGGERSQPPTQRS